MTSPLFISESIPLEVRDILKALEVGQPARYKGFDGFIAFVCEEYISICYKEHPQDETARRSTLQCCMLVYPCDWDDIEINDEHFKRLKHYNAKVNDHPGNDMLPPVNQR